MNCVQVLSVFVAVSADERGGGDDMKRVNADGR